MGTFIFSKKQGGLFAFSPHLLGLTPVISMQGGGLGQARLRRAERVFSCRRLRPVGNLGEDPYARPWGAAGGAGARCGGRGCRGGGQAVPRAGKGEAGPKPAASSPHCRTQPHHRLGPGVCQLRCWRSGAHAGAVVAPQRPRARTARAQGSPFPSRATA